MGLKSLSSNSSLKQALFCAGLLIFAVARSLPIDGQGVAGAGTAVPVTRLIVRYGTNTSRPWNSGLPDKERLVVRERAEWEVVWKRILQSAPSFTMSPSGELVPQVPPAPEIDFAKEMLLVVVMGQHPSGGYSISVESAKEFSDRIEAEVQNVSPNLKQCFLPAMATSPIDIVRMPKTKKTVVFRETEVVRDCK